MNASAIMAAVHEMLMVALLLATPFLLAAAVSSLLIGLIQASTRLNDLTLSFIPRFVAVLMVVYIAAPWATGKIAGYIERSAAAMRAALLG